MTTQELTDLLEATIKEHNISQQHPFVDMAYVCINVIEAGCHSKDIIGQAEMTLSSLMKSMSSYGFNICKDM